MLIGADIEFLYHKHWIDKNSTGISLGIFPFKALVIVQGDHELTK